MSHGRAPIVTTSQACRRIRDRLRHGPLTAPQIAERAFLSINTLTKGGYLRALQSAGLIHVSAWQPPEKSGAWTPVWSLGAGPSVLRPPRQSNNQTAKRWRHKIGNARASMRRDIARKSEAVAPTYAPPAAIRDWLTGAPA